MKANRTPGLRKLAVMIPALILVSALFFGCG